MVIGWDGSGSGAAQLLHLISVLLVLNFRLLEKVEPDFVKEFWSGQNDVQNERGQNRFQNFFFRIPEKVVVAAEERRGHQPVESWASPHNFKK